MRVVLVLVCMASLSVVLRAPLIGRPLGGRHEWLTSTVLRHQLIWEERGLSASRFLPSMTFSNPGDRFVDDSAGLVDQDSGIAYYLSYPPLSYIAPYLVFRVLGIAPDVIPLQLYSMVIGLLAAALVYLLADRLFPVPENRFPWPAVAAFSAYVFVPASLWFHSSVYMADMMVQPFFIAALLLVSLAIESPSWRPWPLALGAVCLVGTYTEWITVMFAVSVCVLAALPPWRAALWRSAVAAAAGALAGILATLAHYSLAGGLGSYLAFMLTKYASRSGSVGGDMRLTSVASWEAVVSHYVSGFGAFLLLLIVAFPTLGRWLRSRAGTAKMEGANSLAPVLLAAAGTVALHHLVFFDFTAIHEFSVLKAVPIVALAWAYLVRLALISSIARRRWVIVAVAGAAVASTALGIAQYYALNYDAQAAPFARIGEQISVVAHPDETVFLEGVKADLYPQIGLYARRTVARWETTATAMPIVNANGTKAGAVFTLSQDESRVVSLRRFRLAE